MTIKPDALIVDEVYFGYYKELEFFAHFVYRGNGTWGRGVSTLHPKFRFQSGSAYYDIYHENTDQVVALAHITKFPPEGKTWSLNESLEVNDFKQQRAEQAARRYKELTPSWPGPFHDLIFFMESNPIVAKNYLPDEPALDVSWIAFTATTTVQAVKKTRKKYRILNCDKGKELYKEEC